jgi:hypothetical protein
MLIFTNILENFIFIVPCEPMDPLSQNEMLLHP